MATKHEFDNLTGYVFRRPQSTPADPVLLFSPDIVESMGNVDETSWQVYVWHSQRPLVREDERFQSPPYEYPIIFRRGSKRWLILSVHRAIVDGLIDRFAGNDRSIRRDGINVNRLVKDVARASVTQKPAVTGRETASWLIMQSEDRNVDTGDLALTFVHGRLSGFGESLRSMSLYGADLSEAALFRHNLDFLTSYTCGLRDAVEESEIVRLGNDGGLSFVFPVPARRKGVSPEEHALWRKQYRVMRFREIEIVLAFLAREHYFMANED